MARVLAHIERIDKIDAIPGKDRIVLAGILGWQVIAKKDEFKVGDLCVYCEIDSVMPRKPEFDFLAKGNYRIKTMKMGGVYSQGICFPIDDVLPKGDYHIGQDVTDIIGVTQYEGTMDIDPDNKPDNSNKLMRFWWYRKLSKLFGGGYKSTAFPSQYVSKTDETRIENAPHYLKNKNPWVATEKLDGQSATYLLIKKPLFGYDFIVCSRNRALPVADNSSYWTIAKNYKIKQVMQKLIGTNSWIALQGEILGPGIQKNKYGLKNFDIYFFNFITPKGRLNSEFASQFIKTVNLKWVPILDHEYILPDTIDELRAWVSGPSQLGIKLKEGVVFRSADGAQSFKCVDPKFLIKNDE